MRREEKQGEETKKVEIVRRTERERRAEKEANHGEMPVAVSYLPRPQVTHVEDRGAPTSATSPLSPAAIYPPLQPTGVAQLVIMRKKCSRMIVSCQTRLSSSQEQRNVAKRCATRMSTGNVFNSQSDLGLETLLSVFLFERPKLQLIVLIFRALWSHQGVQGP